MKAATRTDAGFALITVLAVILIVSAVALTLASTMRVEALQVFGDRTSVELDELSISGQEIATYLASRRLGTALENLEGLPVDAVQPGFHYVVHLPTGDVDLYLDAEDGKLNLSTAPDALLQGFFTAWSGDLATGRELAAAVKDWRDPDDVPEPGGAEAATYLAEGYSPRNGPLSAADAGLLKGLSPEDFRDRLENGEQQRRRPGLKLFFTEATVGGTVNPNYASELVLAAVPGLPPAVVQRAVAQRRTALFRDASDFASRAGLPQESPAWMFLSFARRVPSILTVARSADGRVVRSERRVFWAVNRIDLFTGAIDADTIVGSIERNALPDYIAIP
jgi:type II secretory pathway component PulK